MEMKKLNTVRMRLGPKVEALYRHPVKLEKLKNRHEQRLNYTLQNANECYERMLDAVHQGAQVIGFDWRYLYLNDAAARQSGRSKRESLGHTVMEMHPGIEDSEIFAEFKACMEKRTPHCTESEFTFPDGSKGWFELRIEPVPDGILVLSSDITEQVKLEKALKVRDKAIASFISPIVMVDFEGKLTYVNGSFLSLWKYDDEKEVIGKPATEFWGMRGKAEEITKAVFQKGTWVGEIVAKRKDGSTFDAQLSASMVTDENGKPIIITASFIDLTERKEAEAQLKVEIGLTGRILSSMPNAVLVVGEDLRVLLANTAFYNVFKMRREEVVGEPIYNIMPVVELSRAVSAVSKGGRSGDELELRHKVGALDRVLVANVIPIRKGEVLLLFHDVTEDRGRQERLYLTDRLASIGEMMSGVAHELNNPLTSIIGLSELLMQQDIPDDAKEDVEVIFSEAQRAAEIVKKLLTFARKHEPVRQLTQINKVIQDVLTLRAYVHKVNNIQVNTRLDPALPETTVDYFQMQQVFLNIILNAETAMIESHNKGTLTIITRRTDNTISVVFADDGPGIAKEDLPRIFDPFFTTKEVGKGTGLGLSICYGIVAAHGGKIYAQSELGNGATFVVELPVKIR